MSGKGSKRRPQYIQDSEAALRWQLFTASPQDKPAILEQIEAIRKPIPNEKDKIQ